MNEDGNFVVYKSSAGSGKTFTLVKEYLKLALSDEQSPPEKYRHILAITFTNKAAAEMKERIMSSLQELSEPGSGGQLIQLLQEETGLEKSAITFRAERVLSNILHNYSDFAIGTIDSFVHRIIRTFAYDLKLPVNFEIEMDSDKLLSDVIELLIAKTGTDEHLTRALVEFTEAKAEDEKSRHIEKDLFEFAKNLLTEEGVFHLERLKNVRIGDFLSLRINLNETIRKFESSIHEIATQANTLIKAQELDHTAFYYGRNGISVWFFNLASGNFDKLEPNSYVRKTISENKWFTDKTADSDKAKIEKCSKQLTEAFYSIQTIVEKQQSLYYLCKLINKNIYSLAVLNEIEKLLKQLKKQNNILHISEFNILISKIALSQPVPFIYERLGEKYNHYLIDEFQDTSILQWQNLLPLIENSLGEGYSSMLVGDGKQAIYRWRGGEVEQFSQLPGIFLKEKNEFVLDREKALRRNFTEKKLNKNFRSKKEIVEFNNSLFSVLSDTLEEKYKNIYKNNEQHSDPENKGGFISLDFISTDVDDFEKQSFEYIGNTIMQLLADNYQLNDIAILCRTNKTGGLIAEYLIQKGIGVLSPDSLLLKNSRKVQFLVSLCYNILQPENNTTRVEIIQYLIESNQIKSNLHAVIRNIKQMRNYEFDVLLRQHGLEYNHLHLTKLPLYELTENLVRIFKLGATADGFVRFFMDEVLGFSTSKNNNLSDFLEWWAIRKEKASMNVPDGINAVNIMTIHRSKGLEFPVVILPVDGSKSHNKGNLWVDLKHKEAGFLETVLLPVSRDIEKTSYAASYTEEKNKSYLDDLNMLYVAFTRPEERLYVLCPLPPEKSGNPGTVSELLSYFLKTGQQWSDHRQHYEFGEQRKHDPPNKENKSAVKLKRLQSCDWRKILKIRAEAPQNWAEEDFEDKKDFGLMIHAVLSKVRSAGDLEPILLKFINEGIIDVQEKEELFPKLKRIIGHEKIRNFYKAGNDIKTETGIILPNGETYRPDRVVIQTHATAVIDYKTGLRQDSHIKQINKYAEILTRMGYRDIQKYLVYIEDETILAIQ